MQPKYIFITGGVVSSLGKGLTSASIAMLLESKGLKVAMLKLDPYLNVDPGTMNPFQHGEVYVTDDGAETDLDLGHYYRYTNSPLSQASNATSGQIYNTVLKRERRGDYLGQTVQVIPHVTNEIKHRIHQCAKQDLDTDVVLVEIGGTVGDIESLPFLEAIRQFHSENPGECINIHLTYVPYLKAAGEVKTKPTQHSVQMLRQIGLFPNIILCRCEESLSQEIRDKISLFCNVAKDAVVEAVDVKSSIYELPLLLREQQLDSMICRLLKLDDNPINLDAWNNILANCTQPKKSIRVGIVGKYVEHQDAYKSIFEALDHSAMAEGYKLKIERFEADQLAKEGPSFLKDCDGYLVPGGFGERGWLGKLQAVKHCREGKIPFFGICLGLQAMVVEFARNQAGIAQANSTEIDPSTTEPVISLLSEQEGIRDLGGTMRLGAYPCALEQGSRAAEAYGCLKISERHRHRYEFNNLYKSRLEEAGLSFSGILDGGKLCEIAEVQDHPWMLAVQFHPEFKSKPTAPHPLFHSFMRAMIEHKEGAE
jgi:CTP synthase